MVSSLDSVDDPEDTTKQSYNSLRKISVTMPYCSVQIRSICRMVASLKKAVFLKNASHMRLFYFSLNYREETIYLLSGIDTFVGKTISSKTNWPSMSMGA